MIIFPADRVQDLPGLPNDLRTDPVAGDQSDFVVHFLFPLSIVPQNVCRFPSMITQFPIYFNLLKRKIVKFLSGIRKKKNPRRLGRGSSPRGYAEACSAFSTSAIACFLIGIRQFLLLPNSTITSSSVISMTTP